MTIARQAFRAILRQDLVAFSEKSFNQLNPGAPYLHNWHLDVIAAHLQQCFAGNLRRLIVNVSPRSLKSHLISISFVAWLLGHRPSAQIMCVSHAQELSEMFGGQCRDIMATDWYRDLFPNTRLAAERQSRHDFTTSANGRRLATSIGGAITGRGANYIVIDDPIQPIAALSETQRNTVNDWFDHTLLSRLNYQNTGCIIIVMQRLHQDDLVGHVLKQGGWTVLKFPAIAEQDERHVIATPYGQRIFTRSRGEALHPALQSLETLAAIRQTVGEYNFAGQYQQDPEPLGGGMIKVEWFKSYSPDERPTNFELVIDSWDTAAKSSELNDYSVCTSWGIKDGHLFLLDVVRKRLDYPELRRCVKEHSAIWSASNILIEDRSSGISLIQDLVADGLNSVMRYEPKGDKIMRMHSASSLIENGFVHLPQNAPWLPALLHEFAAFPKGHDDQVDSVSQMLDWFKSRRSEAWAECIQFHVPSSSLGAARRTSDGWYILSPRY